MIFPDMIETLDRQSRPVIVGSGLVLTFLLGLLNIAVGWQYSFEMFYLLPIMLVSFHSGGWQSGLLVSVASAVSWLKAELLSDAPYTDALAPYFDALVRLVLFLIVAIMLANVRRLLQQVERLASTDSLTGVLNGRQFYRQVATELQRSKRSRRPITLAYIDLDNFKTVNDTWGHACGDEVLKTVADTLRSSLRQTDLLARLGGDEFGVLLPEADEAAASEALNRAGDEVRAQMCQRGWPVTCSIGAIIYRNPPTSVDDMVSRADALMYAAKRGGKNAFRLAVDG